MLFTYCYRIYLWNKDVDRQAFLGMSWYLQPLLALVSKEKILHIPRSFEREHFIDQQKRFFIRKRPSSGQTWTTRCLVRYAEWCALSYQSAGGHLVWLKWVERNIFSELPSSNMDSNSSTKRSVTTHTVDISTDDSKWSNCSSTRDNHVQLNSAVWRELWDSWSFTIMGPKKAVMTKINKSSFVIFECLAQRTHTTWRQFG